MAYKINGTTVVDNSRNVCACCVTSCCITASDRMDVPSGNTASRPGSPATGSLYFDTDEGSLVSYDGTDWAAVGGSSVTQTELVQMGNFLGPFVCRGNCSQGPYTGIFNACTCTLYTLECWNSSLYGRSMRWCASSCCLCYLYPTPCTDPTPTNPQSICTFNIGTGAQPETFFCGTPMKCGYTLYYNNTSWSEINGCYLTNTGNSYFCCTICGHCCLWYQGGLNGIYGKFFHNMSNPDFIIRFSGGIFCVKCHPTLCDGCLGCKGMFLSCHCAKCCGQCVGSSTPHKVLWEKTSPTCCVVFKTCDSNKVFCCHNFMAVANGYIAGMMEEGCSNCHVINHYFFVCPETAEVTRLFSCCYCHGYLWDHCNNRDFVKTGMNATLWYAHCCRDSCYAGCFKGTYITVSLKGTEECPCFDPTDYSILCCQFSGCNILDLLKQNEVVANRTSLPPNQNHPLGAYGRLHTNLKPFSATSPSQEAADFSCGWLGRSGVDLVAESAGSRMYKPGSGSYRTATVPNGSTTPVFYTSYVPSDIETWGCLHCCSTHPSTPCPQNLVFICWMHGSGPSAGYSNKWHAGLFCSCNCTCNLCKQLSYVALFCG